MARKKISDKLAEEIKKIAKQENVIIGKDRVIKALKKGAIKHIFLSSNCSESLNSEIEYYAKLSNIEVVKTPYSNEDIGVMFKKQFSISVFGF